MRRPVCLLVGCLVAGCSSHDKAADPPAPPLATVGLAVSAMARAPGGALVVAGDLAGDAAPSDPAFIEIDADGGAMPARIVAAGGDAGSDGGAISVGSVFADDTNDVYLAGLTPVPLLGQMQQSALDPFVCKFDGQGAMQWSMQSDTVETSPVGVDGSGNYYGTRDVCSGAPPITADAAPPQCPTPRYFLAKHDPTGKKLWDYGIDHSFQSDTKSYVDGFVRGTSDRLGDSYTLDQVLIEPPTTRADYLVVQKIDTSGELVWSQQYADTCSSSHVDGFDLASSPDGSALYLRVRDCVSKLDVSGNALWTQPLPIPASGAPLGWTWAVSADGSALYLSAAVAAGASGLLTRYDGAGNVVWTKTISNAADSVDVDSFDRRLFVRVGGSVFQVSASDGAGWSQIVASAP
jgi:hypothetical protein